MKINNFSHFYTEIILPEFHGKRQTVRQVGVDKKKTADDNNRIMKRRKALSPEEVLNAKVVVNEAVRTEEKGKELIVVIPRKKSFFVNLLSFILVVPREKKVILDELGAEVYRDCRQNLPVSEIVANFKKKHNVSEDYGRQSVMIYLKTLAQRSIVGFLIKESKNG